MDTLLQTHRVVHNAHIAGLCVCVQFACVALSQPLRFLHVYRISDTLRHRCREHQRQCMCARQEVHAHRKNRVYTHSIAPEDSQVFDTAVRSIAFQDLLSPSHMMLRYLLGTDTVRTAVRTREIKKGLV